MKFLIKDMKHTSFDGPYWRERGQGSTDCREEAGRYSLERIQKDPHIMHLLKTGRLRLVYLYD